ncbi:hypothetical protein F4860DRAFT_519313 [Xylaria cubensis]|nr:hypothetical protein F4860DRAFT_519313 [Xylaria cubensis]
MSTRELFIEKYLFNEEKGWSALDRLVTADPDDEADGEDGERTVEATMPCASCLTKTHLDLRMRCLCPEGSIEGTKCIFCARDHVACLALPDSLLGAAQIISSFGASLGDRAIRYYNDHRDDPSSLTRIRCVGFGRRYFALTEANLALRKAIQEEERVVLSAPDSERLAIIQAESVSARRPAGVRSELGRLRPPRPLHLCP